MPRLVKVVTDSVADLPTAVLNELGIATVPIYVQLDGEVFRDGQDLSTEQFYDKLQRSRTMPTTSVPSPLIFAETYDRLAQETDQILVITVTSRLSGVNEVAQKAIALMKRRCRVEVLDSRWAIMAQGFIVMKAAQAAKRGAGLSEVVAEAKRQRERVHLRAAFDTLEYLKRGGRVGKAQALVGSILHINPVIGMKDGEVVPVARERSRAKAIDNLYNFAAGFARVDELAVEHAVATADAASLMARLSQKFPGQTIHESHTSPVIGTHTGPSLVCVAVLGDMAAAV
jgi:DegV family protein with EDD domain